jgi:hypothetical protein
VSGHSVRVALRVELADAGTGVVSPLHAGGPLMSTLIAEARPSLDAASMPALPDTLRKQVRGLLAGLTPRGDAVERRNDWRYPYPYLIHLTPVGRDGTTPIGERIVVPGKQLSEHGLGFYHQEPLPYRRMIASLESSTGARLAFLIDLTWCRFMRCGWYESGGRFLQTAACPLGDD